MLLTFLVCLLPLGQTAQALDLLSPFKNMFSRDDSVIIWREPGSFVKIVEQDWDRKHRKAPRNAHPAAIDPSELAVVLASLKTWESEGLSNRQIPVFTTDEIRRLAPPLAEALNRADPDEDVAFAVTGSHDGMSGRRATAGRLFMHDGELNVIFGDLHSPSRGDDDDTSHYAKPHRAGKRMESLSRATRVADGPGMHYWQGTGWHRDDWLKIDIPQTLAAYRGPGIRVSTRTAPQAALTPANMAPVAGSSAPAASGKDLEERWRMREELARLRKQQEQEQHQAPATASHPQPAAPAGTPQAETATAPVQTARSAAPVRTQPAPPAYTGNNSAAARPMDPIERRLTTLKSLHDKDLITTEEFDAKRKEILDEL